MAEFKSLRLAWVDNVKMFAMLCVIIGHSFACITGDFNGYDEINLFIVAFNMSLFVFISGFTSSKGLLNISSLKELMNYINKILWRVGVPATGYSLLCMGVMYSIQNHYIKATISFVLLAFILVSIWFLQNQNMQQRFFFANKAIVIFPYILLPVCLINQSVWFFPFLIMMLVAAAISSYLSSFFLKNRLRNFAIIMLILSIIVSPVSPFYSTAEFYLVFLLGILYKVYPKMLPRYNKCSILLSLFFFILGSFVFSKHCSIPNQFYLSNWWNLISNGSFHIFLLRQLSSISLVIAFLLLIKSMSKEYTKFSYYGSLTLAIYPIHGLIISIFKCKGTPFFTDNIVLGLLIVSIITILLLLISVSVINLLQKTSLTRIALLGTK